MLALYFKLDISRNPQFSTLKVHPSIAFPWSLNIVNSTSLQFEKCLGVKVNTFLSITNISNKLL